MSFKDVMNPHIKNNMISKMKADRNVALVVDGVLFDMRGKISKASEGFPQQISSFEFALCFHIVNTLQAPFA